MTLRDDLRGVRLVDLACAALVVPVLILGAAIGLQETQVQETQVQETQVQEAGDAYEETWDWCGGRFPYREDLQEACRWGAYGMLPGQEVPADEGMKDA